MYLFVDEMEAQRDDDTALHMLMHQARLRTMMRPYRPSCRQLSASRNQRSARFRHNTLNHVAQALVRLPKIVQCVHDMPVEPDVPIAILGALVGVLSDADGKHCDNGVKRGRADSYADPFGDRGGPSRSPALRVVLFQCGAHAAKPESSPALRDGSTRATKHALLVGKEAHRGNSTPVSLFRGRRCSTLGGSLLRQR